MRGSTGSKTPKSWNVEIAVSKITKSVFYPSGLRPDRRGRERFDDREQSLHRTFWKIWTSKFRSSNLSIRWLFPGSAMSRDDQRYNLSVCCLRHLTILGGPELLKISRAVDWSCQSIENARQSRLPGVTFSGPNRSNAEKG